MNINKLSQMPGGSTPDKWPFPQTPRVIQGLFLLSNKGNSSSISFWLRTQLAFQAYAQNVYHSICQSARSSNPSGKKKTNKHKHFRRDGVRDKQGLPLGQTGPLPGTKLDPSLGQTGLSLFNSTVKSPFCPVCPWDGGGFVSWTIVPQGPSGKCLCVFCLLVFLLPQSMESQARSSKRAPRELQSWRVQESPPTLCQTFTNPVPTRRQPFPNPLPTFSANPSLSSSFRGPQSRV